MAIDFTDGLGVNTDSVTTDLKFDDLVSQIAFDWLRNLKDIELPTKLKEKGFIHGGGQESSLAGSTTIEIVDETQNMKFTLSMNDYWKYVESGRGVTKNSQGGIVQKKIKSWITLKGISPADVLMKMGSKDGKTPKRLPFEKALNSLSYIIARSIHRKGTIKRFGYKGSNFLKETLTENVPLLKQELETQLGRRVQISVVNNLKGLK